MSEIDLLGAYNDMCMQLRRVTAERDALAARIDKALSVHFRVGLVIYCGRCNEEWPCATARALTEDA